MTRHRFPFSLQPALIVALLLAGCGVGAPTTQSPTRPCAPDEIRTDVSVYSLHPGEAGYSGVPFTLTVDAEGGPDFPGVTLIDDMIRPSEQNTHTRIGYRSWWKGRDKQPAHVAQHVTPWETAVICYPRMEPSRIRVSATYDIIDGPNQMMITYDSLECAIEDEYVTPPPQLRTIRTLDLADLAKRPDPITGKKSITATCDMLYTPDSWSGELPHELPQPPPFD